MFAATAVIPPGLLAPFPDDTRRAIEDEASADPVFGRRIAGALSRPGGAIAVANSMRRAAADELSGRPGQWPVLRRMVRDLVKSAGDDVDRHVASMTLQQKTAAMMSIAARGSGLAGLSGLGQAPSGGAGAAAGGSALGAVSGIAGAVAGVVATIYSAKVISSANRQVASIQASAQIHNADVQLQIAQAQAAMDKARATMISEGWTPDQSGNWTPPQGWAPSQGAAAPPPPDQAQIVMAPSGAVPSDQAAASPIFGQQPGAPAHRHPAAPVPAPSGPALNPLTFIVPAAVVGGGALLYQFLGDAPQMSAEEMEAYRALPGPIRKILEDEASENPHFFREYLQPALHAPFPAAKIIDDMSREMAEHQLASHGMGHLGKSFFKKVVRGMRKIEKKTVQTIRKVQKKIEPKFMQKIHVSVSRAGKKVWHQYGAIIIGVVGAILAPFTGGASLAAAAILVAAKQMSDAKAAARDAVRQNKAEATQMNAQANAQQAQVAQQVDQFYQQNQGWFVSQGITPDAWAKLTLDQKIEIINAGANGTLPQGATPVPDPQAAQMMTPQQAQQNAQDQVAAAAASAVPPAAPAPPPAPTGPAPVPQSPPATAPGASNQPVYQDVPQGPPAPTQMPEAEVVPATGSDQPQDQGPTVAPDQAQGPQSPQPTIYTLVVEGKTVGTFSSIDDASIAAANSTTPGDRFEILSNGQSTGLKIRTSTTIVAVPPEQEAQVRAIPRSQMGNLVAQAEGRKPQTAAGGGGAAAAVIALLVGGAYVLS